MRKKISRSKKGKSWEEIMGEERSEGAKQKLRDWWTSERRKEQSQRIQRILKENNPMNNEENRQKVSLSLKGREVTWAHKLHGKKNFSWEQRLRSSKRITELNQSVRKREAMRVHALRRWRNGELIMQKISKPQRELFKIVKKEFLEAELNKRIITGESVRFLDVAVPSLLLDIEFDCEVWHNKESDRQRDEELLNFGWRTIRLGYDELNALKSGKLLNEIVGIV